MKPRYDMFSWLLSRMEPTESQPEVSPHVPDALSPAAEDVGPTAKSPTDVDAADPEIDANTDTDVKVDTPLAPDVNVEVCVAASDDFTDTKDADGNTVTDQTTATKPVDRSSQSGGADDAPIPRSAASSPLAESDPAAAESSAGIAPASQAAVHSREPDNAGVTTFLAPDPPTSPRIAPSAAVVTHVAKASSAPEPAKASALPVTSGISVPPPTAGGFVTIPAMPGPPANLNTVDEPTLGEKSSNIQSHKKPLLAQQIGLMRALEEKTEWVRPRVGMTAVELAPPKMRIAHVIRVLARGRRVIAEIDETSRPYGYTLRYDGSYRLEGAPAQSAPRLVLARKS